MTKHLVADVATSSKATKRCLGKKPPTSNALTYAPELQFRETEHFRQSLLEAADKLCMECIGDKNGCEDPDCWYCVFAREIRISAGETGKGVEG